MQLADQNGSSLPPTAAVDGSKQAAPGKKKKKDGFVKRLYRQNLNGYVPIPRPKFAITFFLSVGVVLVSIGVALFVTALNVNQEEVRYDDRGSVSGGMDLASLSNDKRLAAMYQTQGNGWEYTLDIKVKNKLRAPVYVYYKLGNYYQNYRRYINSANWNQLNGKSNPGSLDTCKPIKYVDSSRAPSDKFPNEGIVKPCGLWAWSFFNDTYAFEVNGQQVPVDASQLAWAWQRNHLFGKVKPENFNGGTRTVDGQEYNATAGGGEIQGSLNEDERFMVWMRPEAHYTFQKLWGVINQDIPEGATVRVTVTNRYNMYHFGGLKSVVLSENSWMGGRNLFLGILMLVVGGLYLLCALVFVVGRMLNNRPLGDERYLSWHRMQQQKGFVNGFREFVRR